MRVFLTFDILVLLGWVAAPAPAQQRTAPRPAPGERGEVLSRVEHDFEGDGRTDFNLGQYVSCDGWRYAWDEEEGRFALSAEELVEGCPDGDVEGESPGK